MLSNVEIVKKTDREQLSRINKIKVFFRNKRHRTIAISAASVIAIILLAALFMPLLFFK